MRALSLFFSRFLIYYLPENSCLGFPTFVKDLLIRSSHGPHHLIHSCNRRMRVASSSSLASGMRVPVSYTSTGAANRAPYVSSVLWTGTQTANFLPAVDHGSWHDQPQFCARVKTFVLVGRQGAACL